MTVVNGHTSGLTVGAVARILHLAPNTLRSWDRRSNVSLSASRTPSGHRRYERRMILALKDALAEGHQGEAVAVRALELVQSGRYEEPALKERMTAVEHQLARVVAELRLLRVELRRP